MDPLSDVLEAVRFTGAYFYLVEASAPWSVSAAAACDYMPRIMPDSDHLIPYHILVEGECWGGVAREAQIRMRPGDVIAFPRGEAHTLATQPGQSVDSLVYRTTPDRYPNTLKLGEGATDAKFVCGFFGCDASPFNPLLNALPSVLHLRNEGTGWLASFPEHAVREAQLNRAGTDTMLTRMAELMFVEVLRRHLESLGDERTGWLAGLRDPVVGAALTQMHARPAHDWTLASLAHEVASSRSVLAERFTQIVGIPPMQYLSQWRLQLAANHLTRGSAKVAAVGTLVGYDSEAAFSRAFKRATGESPSAWRQRRQRTHPSR